MRNVIQTVNSKAIAAFALIAIGAALLTGCEAPMHDGAVSTQNLSAQSEVATEGMNDAHSATFEAQNARIENLLGPDSFSVERYDFQGSMAVEVIPHVFEEEGGEDPTDCLECDNICGDTCENGALMCENLCFSCVVVCNQPLEDPTGPSL